MSSSLKVVPIPALGGKAAFDGTLTFSGLSRARVVCVLCVLFSMTRYPVTRTVIAKLAKRFVKLTNEGASRVFQVTIKPTVQYERYLFIVIENQAICVQQSMDLEYRPGLTEFNSGTVVY